MNTPAAPRREDYGYQLPVQIRWGDFDLFGHLNNVTYYRYYELLITAFLQDEAGMNWVSNAIAPFVAENSCRYLRPIDEGGRNGFGKTIVAALRVEHLGTKSVRYDLALFQDGDDTPSATGKWVHVFVDKETGRSAPIPENVRTCYQRFLTPPSGVGSDF